MNAVNGKQQLEMDLAWFSDLLQKDAEQIELPDSLRSENLLPRIEQIVPSDDTRGSPFAGRRVALRFLPYAAGFVLIFLGWHHMMGDGKNSLAQAAPAAFPEASAPAAAAQPQAARGAEQSPPPEAPAASAELFTMAAPAAEDEYAAQDYAEVYHSLEAAWSNRQQATAGRAQLLGDAMGMSPGAAEFGAADSAVMKSEAVGAGGAGVYRTNTQIEGIDEADIVKTDGTYIYQYRFNRDTGGAQISIVAANGLKLLSSIDLPEYTDAQLYVSGDRLVVVQSIPEKAARLLSEQVDQPASRYVGEDTSASSSEPEVIIPDYGIDSYIAMTEAVIYDVGSRQQPKEIYRFAQDGHYVSSRLLDDVLYLVTNKQVYAGVLSTELPARELFPVVGAADGPRLLEARDIVIAPYLESPAYAVVTSLDLALQTARTKAVLGMADQIMMSSDSLFLTASIADDKSGGWRDRDTGITRFSVTGGAMRYVSSGRVDGTIDNQFSLDEYAGNLRIATTGVNGEGETTNNLYVLDAQMKKIGALEDLAVGERIYSVRYRGKTAYVVTFRQVDPLFVIDLSDPKRPTVKGELKIPGFSEYLHPIDDNTLVGLGMNTTTTKYGGVVQDGMKLSLFDVSDPVAPRETASLLLGNMGSYSEAIDNHRAFLYYPQQRLIGLPAVIYTTSGATAGDPWSGERSVSFSGYLVIRVNKDGFEIAGTIPSEDEQQGFHRYDYNNAIERGLYIGKTLYTVSSARLRAFSLDTFAEIGELVYPS